jgi:hypothetical protein
MTWQHSRQVALGAALLAVLLMLYAHILYFIRHSAG